MPPPPWLWLAALYGLASVVCFIVYAADKSAAVGRRRRVSERTLLLLGLACGWPGALLAQRWLRHKTAKTRFQVAFWCGVAANVAAVWWLCTVY
ncbi:Uncharacterized membrane protein YsdA, DUF1294 family [Duganella sp. CF517]|uniref:DUF1294 domain-containing protein n=1 Tax=Duganella sp. CF517 TaxID=1881038 RepID=UPI0008B85802|nr:DUF1294 domain-containing protein [Duganella sp. CF517]SEO07409.1 Uncharacterized membrane protein YsdA, DUF1294 family [Duganella sp. CF517]